MKYTDPTGHCNQAGDDGDDPGACQVRLSVLEQYSISVEDYASGVWSLAELDYFSSAVKLLQRVAGWSIEEFHSHIGDVNITQSLDWTGGALDNPIATAVTWPNPIGGHSSIVFYQSSLYATKQDMANNVLDKQFFKRTVIHELAHAWDFHTGLAKSAGLAFVTSVVHRGGFTTTYGGGNVAEDWAESVAEYVTYGQNVDQYRKEYVRKSME